MRHSTCTVVTTLSQAVALPTTAYPGRSAGWPVNPGDVTPLQWWRMIPGDRINDAQYLLLQTTLEKISHSNRRAWLNGMRGNAAAGIAIALHSLPITTVTIEFDLAMSAIALHALSGDAASALVLSHILRRTPLDHPFAEELAASWLALNLRHTMRRSLKTAAQASHLSKRDRLLDQGDVLFTGELA